MKRLLAAFPLAILALAAAAQQAPQAVDDKQFSLNKYFFKKLINICSYFCRYFN